MLTPNELQKLELNHEAVTKAFDLASMRLDDLLKTKDRFETKRDTLLNIQIGFATALIGLSQWKAIANPMLDGIVVATGLLLVGIGCLVTCFDDKIYGSPGCNPSMWLRQGVIDTSGQKPITANLAYLLCDYEQRIETSNSANNKKADRIRVSLACGIAAMVVATIGAVISII